MQKFLVIVWAAVTAVVLTGGLSFSADAVKWKMQSAYPPGDAIYDIHSKETAKRIETVSGGKIKIDLFAPGALCTVGEMVNALSRGMIDMGCIYGPTYAGSVPVGDVEAGLPFTWVNPDQVIDLFWGSPYRMIDAIREGWAKKNIFYFQPNSCGSYLFLLNFPVNKISDFKGHKIRAMGATGEWVKRAGAAPTSLPAAEIYMAIKLGTIEGTVFPPQILGTLKLKEVVKYVIFPGMVAPPHGCIVINLDSWKALPDDVKKELIADQKSAEVYRAYGKAYQARDDEALKEAYQVGVKSITLPESEIKEGRRLAVEIWDMVGAKDPSSKKAVEIWKRYVADKGLM
jgi:TRAP-type C4-dicarboxylate transport system substrate-binding protein